MEALLRDWGYLGIFVGILATGLGFPMPEELPVVVGGVLAGSDRAHWWIMLPVCIVGVVIGDSFLYIIGRLWGTKLVETSFIRKRLLPPERFASIQENFQNYGIKILLFARLTPGIRAPIFLTAGITRLPLTHFLLADAIYAIPGVSLLFFLGYWFTDNMVSFVQNEAETAKFVIILLVIVGIAGYLAYRFFRRPVVTGNPSEMTPILGGVTTTLDDTMQKILHRDEPSMDPNRNGTSTSPRVPASNEK